MKKSQKILIGLATIALFAITIVIVASCSKQHITETSGLALLIEESETIQGISWISNKNLNTIVPTRA